MSFTAHRLENDDTVGTECLNDTYIVQQPRSNQLATSTPLVSKVATDPANASGSVGTNHERYFLF